jgi:hypothetical protein
MRSQRALALSLTRLIGSRIAVRNAEVRVPVFGPVGIVPKTQFVPPVEVAPFVDVGLAWNRYQPVAQRPVSSAGTSLRFNIFGFAIAQVSLVQSKRPARKELGLGVQLNSWVLINCRRIGRVLAK